MARAFARSRSPNSLNTRSVKRKVRTARFCAAEISRGICLECTLSTRTGSAIAGWPAWTDGDLSLGRANCCREPAKEEENESPDHRRRRIHWLTSGRAASRTRRRSIYPRRLVHRLDRQHQSPEDRPAL